MKRDFAEWLLTFTDSIADYKYEIRDGEIIDG